MTWAIDQKGYSQQRACALIGIGECLALVVDTSISGRRVTRELDAIVAARSKPLMIVSDNGTELTSHAILRWQEERGVGWHYIAPGKPVQNAFVESLMYGRPLRCKVGDGDLAVGRQMKLGLLATLGAPPLRRRVQ